MIPFVLKYFWQDVDNLFYHVHGTTDVALWRAKSRERYNWKGEPLQRATWSFCGKPFTLILPPDLPLVQHTRTSRKSQELHLGKSTILKKITKNINARLLPCVAWKSEKKNSGTIESMTQNKFLKLFFRHRKMLTCFSNNLKIIVGPHYNGIHDLGKGAFYFLFSM